MADYFRSGDRGSEPNGTRARGPSAPSAGGTDTAARSGATRTDSGAGPAAAVESQGASSLLPNLTAPKGGGAIRGIGEKFSVNAATGTASLMVPLAASPGRSGFGPQVELSYDSGNGNGVFGLGFRLSVPTITRKTDKGIPRYYDDEESDEYILSGAEDLVPTRNPNGSLLELTRTLGPTTYRVRRHRPRVEGLFANIERWIDGDSGDVHWRVTTRDNVTHVYGLSSSARCFPGKASRDSKAARTVRASSGSTWTAKASPASSSIPTTPGTTRKNRGAGKLTAPRVLSSMPSPAQLGTGVQQLEDLGGDGQLDLVAYDEPLEGYFTRTTEGGFETLRNFRDLPSIDFRDPNLRFLDVDGDGLPDILITEDRAFVWYRSKGKEGGTSEHGCLRARRSGRASHALAQAPCRAPTVERAPWIRAAGSVRRLRSPAAPPGERCHPRRAERVATVEPTRVRWRCACKVVTHSALKSRTTRFGARNGDRPSHAALAAGESGVWEGQGPRSQRAQRAQGGPRWKASIRCAPIIPPEHASTRRAGRGLGHIPRRPLGQRTPLCSWPARSIGVDVHRNTDRCHARRSQWLRSVHLSGRQNRNQELLIERIGRHQAIQEGETSSGWRFGPTGDALQGASRRRAPGYRR